MINSNTHKTTRTVAPTISKYYQNTHSNMCIFFPTFWYGCSLRFEQPRNCEYSQASADKTSLTPL
uniref:Uncharacterized protein n=1 Tax=Utricularia reniformis TaxID=192314 RepID=A0A1Y0B049_9LAMI|nr:hypothetical protein AEK19_MT0560 [Utricularia reniformis]ART30816.1 hypothetical protein AEK19_MT0560 [Utricularia reniformis]